MGPSDIDYWSSTGPPRLAALAAAQHGVVSRRQLAELGLSQSSIQHRITAGWLHRVHRGVYAVGHASLSVDGRRMAIVLASGPGAALSHRSAAVAWGLMGGGVARWDVTVPGRSGGRVGADGARLHRTRRLHGDDVCTLRGVRMTTVARTLVDLADGLDDRRLDRVLHEAEVARLLDVAAVREAAARAPGRRGGPRLLAALSVPAEPRPDEFTSLFAELCERHGLPRPSIDVHVEIDGVLRQVDALFVRQRVAVELDSERVHHTRRRFHADRRRDAAVAARGYLTVRLTWRRIVGEPVAVAAELGAILRHARG